LLGASLDQGLPEGCKHPDGLLDPFGIGLQLVCVLAFASPEHSPDNLIVHAEGLVDQCAPQLQQGDGHHRMASGVAEQPQIVNRDPVSLSGEHLATCNG
jgi:hypothetical protein